MKKLSILFVLLTVAAIGLKAQNPSVIQGVCKNEKGQTIENVSVYAKDSLLVSNTDENG